MGGVHTTRQVGEQEHVFKQLLTMDERRGMRRAKDFTFRQYLNKDSLSIFVDVKSVKARQKVRFTLNRL